MKVSGIHHVTSITAQIAANRQFYTGLLGLRLVKKSINQDDVKAYHLFYADAVGSPGTDLTFFDWPDAAPNLPGPGAVASTSLRVSGHSALGFWEDRLRGAGLYVERGEDPLGRQRLQFADEEGQALELVDASDLPHSSHPWAKEVPSELAIQGLFGVDIASARPDGTRAVLMNLLGFDLELEDEVEVLRVRGEDSSAEVRLSGSSSRRMGRPGAGGVHHVAFRIRDDEELLAFQKEIESKGISTSGLVDRFWFHSLYFREPGGVLFELATDGPGMGSDESLDSLGETLALPPFLEDRRAEIEAGLKEI